MMIPEHAEGINELNAQQKKRERIYLDEQELDYISRALQDSLRQRIVITVKLYHPLEDLQVIGVVERIDRSIGRFKVDGEWFILGDIEGIDYDAG